MQNICDCDCIGELQKSNTCNPLPTLIVYIFNPGVQKHHSCDKRIAWEKKLRKSQGAAEIQMLR